MNILVYIGISYAGSLLDFVKFVIPIYKKGKRQARKYCDYHAEKHSLGDSETDQVCIDCGKTFTRSAHAAMQIRCPACQKEHRRHR